MSERHDEVEADLLGASLRRGVRVAVKCHGADRAELATGAHRVDERHAVHRIAARVHDEEVGGLLARVPRLGLLCGLELVENRDTREPADALGLALTDECQRCGLSINLVRGGTGGQANCLRMAPPLTVAEDEINLA